jgi:hypothetical protein
MDLVFCNSTNLLRTSAPTWSFPPTEFVADSMNTYGTKRATSISGVSGPIAPEISVARATASSRVWGFNFQLPLMKGLRAISRELELEARIPLNEGENADAELKRVKADRAVNFIVGIGYYKE